MPINHQGNQTTHKWQTALNNRNKKKIGWNCELTIYFNYFTQYVKCKTRNYKTLYSKCQFWVKSKWEFYSMLMPKRPTAPHLSLPWCNLMHWWGWSSAQIPPRRDITPRLSDAKEKCKYLLWTPWTPTQTTAKVCMGLPIQTTHTNVLDYPRGGRGEVYASSQSCIG